VPDTDRPTVAVLADDLIWSSRLVAAIERAEATALRASTPVDLQRHLDAGARAAVIDLGGRRYDGIAAVEAAAASGLPTIAVGQHEDLALRRRALAAGAQRVYSYNKLFRDGPAVIAGLLARNAPAEVG
jgi:hypothetical protein